MRMDRNQLRLNRLQLRLNRFQLRLDHSQLPLDFTVARANFVLAHRLFGGRGTHLHSKERTKQLMHSIIKSYRIFDMKLTSPFIRFWY